jgi:hypothetical protein
MLTRARIVAIECATYRTNRNAREHLAQKRFWIVAVEFGGGQQAVHCRSAITACIAAGEQISLALMETFP